MSGRPTLLYLILIFFTSFMVGGVVIYWHWEAMLISYLAVRTINLPFSDLSGLYASDYSLFVYPGSGVWDTFKFGSPLRQNIFKDKLEPYEEEYVTYKDRPSQIARLLSDSENAMFALFQEVNPFEEYTSCKFIDIPGRYDPLDFAIGYQLNSPYAGLFDYWITRMRENGMLDALKTKYQTPKQKCPDLRFVVMRN